MTAIWDEGMEAISGAVGSQALQALKDVLAATWNELSQDERASCLYLLKTMVKVRLKELLGFDVSDHLPILQAAFDQWKVVGKQVVVDGIQKVAAAGFGLAGTFAGSALAAFVKTV